MKTYFPPNRLVNLIACVACCLSLAIGFYMQFAKGIEPCPLCIVQRLVYILLALVFGAAAIHNPTTKIGVRIYGGIGIFLASLGAIAAGRHIWMQLHPLTAPDLCFPGFSNIFTFLSPIKALQVIFQSADNCAHISWKIWGLSIAVWSLLGFVVLGCLSIWQIFNRAAVRNHS